MYQYSSKEYQFDELLQLICGELQITKTQHKQAETSYMAIAKWLSDDKVQFPDCDINIYSQGSLRIGTTVRPIIKQEFDLDLVCEFKLDWKKYKNAILVLDKIEKRLKENATYAPMVERKNRCVRLNYNRNFHMDILPACPVVVGDIGGCVKVPDRKEKCWKDSNPKGYANWFDEVANNYKQIIEYSIPFENKSEIDKLPDVEPLEIKPPLKCAVQLIKRYRDIYFKNTPKEAPISIVLTTLAGKLYSRQGSVNETITGILDSIQDLVQNGKKIIVKNPTNELEILSESWDSDEKLYMKFIRFINDFREKWNKINELKNTGLIEVSAVLKEMFGEKPINEGLIKQAAYTEEMRKSGKLGVASKGVLTTDPVATNKEIVTMKRNTFYGFQE